MNRRLSTLLIPPAVAAGLLAACAAFAAFRSVGTAAVAGGAGTVCFAGGALLTAWRRVGSLDEGGQLQQSDFLGAVCHELKTPLAGIRAYAEMLGDGDVEDEHERREIYRAIETQIDRATRLVNDMHNLSRIERGKIPVRYERRPLAELLQEAVRAVQPAAEAAGRRVHVDPGPEEILIDADPALFRQAVAHILTQALEQPASGGDLYLSGRREAGRATVEVRLDGKGLPAETLPHVFDPMFRVPESAGERRGTGLELALARAIVTAVHAGTIAVTSADGAGVTFTVTIPSLRADRIVRKPDPTPAPASGPPSTTAV